MKSFRKIQVIILSICLSLSTSFSMAGAHSGRTDAMGGHHDYQNKSGLGSYHYHCGVIRRIYTKMVSVHILPHHAQQLVKLPKKYPNTIRYQLSEKCKKS